MRRGDPPVIFELIGEPLILRREADQQSSRFPAADDDNHPKVWRAISSWPAFRLARKLLVYSTVQTYSSSVGWKPSLCPQWWQVWGRVSGTCGHSTRDSAEFR